MGRLERRYEREAEGWLVAAVQTVLVLPVVIVVGAAIGAAVLVLISWGVVGALIWLSGWPVALVSKNAGRRIRAAGVQQLNAMEKASDEWTHPRRTKERKQAAARAERVAIEAQAQDERAAAEAPALAARAAAEAEAKTVALREWLEGPPPTLYVPRRFSEDWFGDNVPKLHPGQVPALLAELHARGWTDQRIGQRLTRYLATNPFYQLDTGHPLLRSDGNRATPRPQMETGTDTGERAEPSLSIGPADQPTISPVECHHTAARMAVRLPCIPCEQCRGHVDGDGTVMSGDQARRRYPEFRESVDANEARWHAL